ncbi:MAG: sulfurtransferase [Pseudarthrobacter sp.]|nr:sulfurtransferase [Pseudarthrobacter sp.]
MGPLMDVVGLAARIKAGQPTVLLDVRWKLGDPHGRDHYLEAHLPGAVFVDLAAELAGPAAPERGRHPLPPLEQFQASARGWGISDGDVVVAYDDSGNMAAARLWWMLRNAGFADICMLDGGLAAWRAAGLPVEAGNVEAAPGDVSLREGAMPALDAAAAGTWAGTGILLDARAGERYRGEFEPVDPRAGHIPGAVSAPTTGNVDASGRFLPAAELRRRFEALGVSGDIPVAVYCGSGVTAAHEVAALELAGISAALYPGSFSEWSNNPALPVVTGSQPG